MHVYTFSTKIGTANTMFFPVGLLHKILIIPKNLILKENCIYTGGLFVYHNRLKIFYQLSLPLKQINLP